LLRYFPMHVNAYGWNVSAESVRSNILEILE